jgi:hypothetical protein
MRLRINRLKILFILIAVAVPVVGACAAPSVQSSPTPAQPAVEIPVIRDIVGAQEWYPGEEGLLICDCPDADKKSLSYTWIAENGTIKGEGHRVYWTPPGVLGEYQITLKVTDVGGKEEIFSKKFRVVAAPAPPQDTTIYLELTPPKAFATSASTQIRGLSTSEIQCVVPGDVSEYVFSWTVDAGKLMAAGLEEGKADRVGWISPNQAGKYKVNVVVTDRAGNSAAGEVIFEVLCCGRGPN